MSNEDRDSKRWEVKVARLLKKDQPELYDRCSFLLGLVLIAPVRYLHRIQVEEAEDRERYVANQRRSVTGRPPNSTRALVPPHVGCYMRAFCCGARRGLHSSASSACCAAGR